MALHWGLFSILLHPSPDREDYLLADLLELGTTGVAEEPGGLRAFFDESSALNSLLARFAEFSPEPRTEEQTDWAQVARDAWPPLLCGRRFYLVAPWHRNQPTPPGRLRLEIEPGMACGTGRHPATQLCLEAIERHVRPGDSVLDVGTGSGILARAARLMGARRVVACDIDPEPVRIARDHDASLLLFTGSADAVRPGWADVITANIDADAIERLAPELARVRKPGSILILSGFRAGDLPEGFRASQTLQQGDWLCWIG